MAGGLNVQKSGKKNIVPNKGTATQNKLGLKPKQQGKVPAKKGRKRSTSRKGSKGSLNKKNGDDDDFKEPNQEWQGIRSERRTLIIERRRMFRVLNSLKALLTKWFMPWKKKAKGEEGKEWVENPPRYKQPIERFLKRVKKERYQDIPQDINIHRHKIKGESFIRSHGVRKEVDIIHKALAKFNFKSQPSVGFEYNKRQRRLLLGRRHRKLETGWRYFEPLKRFLPRKIKPNNRLPDRIFFFFSVLLFISVGVQNGTSIGARSWFWVLEDAKEYELSQKSLFDDDKHQGRDFWDETAPFQSIADKSIVLNGFLCVVIVLGFVGVYLADQTLHLIYFIGILLSLLVALNNARIIETKDYCTPLLEHATPLLQLLTDKYYEKIEAFDMNGETVYWNKLGQREPVKIRTYKAANIMDRIQNSWRCCGVEGFDDYLKSNMPIPSSCCNPLWNLNPYCASDGLDGKEYRLHAGVNGKVGCKYVLIRFCQNVKYAMGWGGTVLHFIQLVLFLVSCYGLVLQARQIRQFKRKPHLRISAGTISQSLQTSAGPETAIKTGGGGLQAMTDATKLTDKQAEHIQQLRRDAALHQKQINFDSESSSESSEAPVHTVDFMQMKNLQEFVDTEDRPDAAKENVEKAVEGFAGRFNIVANKNLQPYVPGIFSSTFQNETNAGLEALNLILEKQFAQHTTDYNWKKLLIKPKKEHQDAMAATLAHKERQASSDSG